MPVEYGYFVRGEQKRLEQTKRWGKRISFLGAFQASGEFYLWSRVLIATATLP